MDRNPRVLVMGATGQVGGAVVNHLKGIGSIDVVAVARNVSKARSLGVPVVHLDLDDIETFAPALMGVDRLFMATGYTVDMLRQSKDLVNYAKRAGVKLIVHLGACGDDDTRVAHYGWHQFIERYIESSGIPFVHLRRVDCEDVAAVTSECLVNPTRHIGNTYRLGYDAKSYQDIAQIMTETLGESFRYEPRPPSEFLSHVLAAGAEPAYMKCVFDSYTDFTDGSNERADEVFDNFPALVGRAPCMLSDFIRNHADEFRY